MTRFLVSFSKAAKKAILFIAVICLVMIPAQVNSADYSKYHTYDEMTSILRDLVRQHSDIAKLVEIGKTLEGRTLWAVEIANTKGTPVDSRPGLFIAGNLEGDHVIGSELALFTIEYLLTNYQLDNEVKNSIDNHVFYIIPRVNPDGAEMMFASLKTGKKTNTSDYDDDNDGRMNEDGPDDLNSDGFITVMRVKDRKGRYMIDPDNAKLMKRADPKKGETGGYKLYWEGLDNDGDGFINEDPSGGVDINRNFQHVYPYYKKGAGFHMVSELESRALMDYILNKKNTALILTFGESDNLITAPASNGSYGKASDISLFNFAEMGNTGFDKVGTFPKITGGFGRFGGFRMFGRGGQSSESRGPGPRKPEVNVNNADNSYYKTISDEYKKLTGIKKAPFLRRPEGAFFQYGYFQFGVPSFSTPGWGINSEEQSNDRPAGRGGQAAATPRAGGRGMQRPGGGGGASGGSGVDADMLSWMDKEGIDGFVDWTAYSHPTLGDVEIGGFKPYEVINPPAVKIAELGESNAKFALYLSTLYAEVKIVNTEVVDHGGGVFRIKAEVANNGFLPTSTAHGVRSRSVRNTMVQLGVNAEDIISGNRKTNYFNKLDGSGNVNEYEWVIKGKSGQKVELKVVSQKGGSDTKTLTLR